VLRKRSLSIDVHFSTERRPPVAPNKKDSRWWLREGSETVVVATSPETVYDLVADLPRMGEWSPECVRVEWEGGANAPVVGAAFVGYNRGGPGKRISWSRHGRVVAAEPGKEFAFATEEGGRESTTWTYRFEETEVGTRPLNRRGELHRHMRLTLEHLKAAAEATERAADSAEGRS
jgi:uncharacterized protein YndB with AHSA1/START domain